jgi:hypothetical protein
MGSWLIGLTGSEFDLKDMAKLFGTPELSVMVKRDGYYLSSSDFEAMIEVEDVRSRGAELVALANGIAKVHYESSEDVRMDEVIRDEGDGTSRHFGCLYTSARVVVDEEGKLSDGTCVTPKRLADTEAWIVLASQDDLVKDALNFLNEGATWWGLRKAYEAVVEGSKLQPSWIQEQGWATREELKRFREWANYYVHGRLGRPPDPRHTAPMSLMEAGRFVRRLLSKWLRWKATGAS